jgi:hypothetical protein
LKDIRQEIADDTADTMDGKDIKGIIHANEVLEFGRVVARNGTDDTKDNSRPGRDVTGRRSDGNETSDGTRAPADSRPFAFKSEIDQDPCKSTDGGSKISDDASHGSTKVAAERGTTVESEPTEPEEDGSEDDVRDIVRSVVKFMGAVSTALAQHDGIGEGGGTRRDVDGSTSSEIESAQLVDPTVGVPRPAGNGIIDNGCPDKDEDDGRKHTTTLGDSANGESRGNSSEHTLENGKEKIGNVAGFLGKNTLETKVVEISNEFAPGPGKGKRITPEEPLESQQC